jgi:uncharacterized RDD family membrane protein YckC
MKCQGCGCEYPSTLASCTRCGEPNQRRSQRPTESRLIEFPRRPRVSETGERIAAPLPPWRAELNERVRAVRARKSAIAAGQAEIEGETVSVDPIKTSGSSVSTGVATANPHQTSRSRDSVTNPIVEAALTRVRRASKNASRTASQRVETGRGQQLNSIGAQASDRHATARALAPDTEISAAPAPPSNHYSTERLLVKPAEPVPVTSPLVRTNELDDNDPSIAEFDAEPGLVAVDEIEPIDYLAAEIGKVEVGLAGEFAKNESAPLSLHIVINLVDLSVVAIAAAPFLISMGIFDGDFSTSPTRIAVAAIVGLVALFYLFLTQGLSGKSFGMMMTNTRVVDARSFDHPSPPRILVRSVGYLIGVGFAMIGLLAIAFNQRRRGLHDLLSGTVVVRDF